MSTAYKMISLEEADALYELGIPVELHRIGADGWDWIVYPLDTDLCPSEDYALFMAGGYGDGRFEYRVEVE